MSFDKHPMPSDWKDLSPRTQAAIICQRQIATHDEISFWATVEKDFREKYGENPNDIQCKHLNEIKKLRKEAEDNLRFWNEEAYKLL